MTVTTTEADVTEHHMWYFTFGFSHRHPRTGESLANHYTAVDGTYDEARARVHEVFDRNWAFQYHDADGPNGAGVTVYDLKYVPCVDYSPCELLPPTPSELECGEWTLETYLYTDTYVERCTEPYYPSITELTYMLKKYAIPSTACIEYRNCGSHTLVVTWDVTSSRRV